MKDMIQLSIRMPKTYWHLLRQQSHEQNQSINNIMLSCIGNELKKMIDHTEKNGKKKLTPYPELVL